MLVIRFGKWNHKATSMFIYTRIFGSGYKWTPLCIKKFRYVGDLGNTPVIADTNNPTITFTNKQTNESFDVKTIKYTPDKDGWRAGAIAQLKKQEVEIEKLNRFINGFSRNAVPVVRCKDCKYYDCHNGCMSWHDVNSKNDNWYCADGERRMDDA